MKTATLCKSFVWCFMKAGGASQSCTDGQILKDYFACLFKEHACSPVQSGPGYPTGQIHLSGAVQIPLFKQGVLHTGSQVYRLSFRFLYPSLHSHRQEPGVFTQTCWQLPSEAYPHSSTSSKKFLISENCC